MKKYTTESWIKMGRISCIGSTPVTFQDYDLNKYYVEAQPNLNTYNLIYLSVDKLI
jgi:hypothetical protein